jgi:hypothetical protein
VGGASMADAATFIGAVVGLLWIALAVAIAVFVVAFLSKVLGPVVRWVEARAQPVLTRWTRVHHGLPPDAPRWACRACHSVNEPTAAACYRCGTPAEEAAEALPEPAGGELFAPLPPPNRFDPALYRGPGAPAEPADGSRGLVRGEEPGAGRAGAASATGPAAEPAGTAAPPVKIAP